MKQTLYIENSKMPLRCIDCPYLRKEGLMPFNCCLNTDLHYKLWQKFYDNCKGDVYKSEELYTKECYKMQKECPLELLSEAFSNEKFKELYQGEGK